MDRGLSSPSQALALPAPETLDIGGDTENRQYQHILAVAWSQETRLLQHAALRKSPGYDLSDPWLVATEEADGAQGKRAKRTLVPGMPCQLRGQPGGVVSYLGPGSDAAAGDCRIRLASGEVVTSTMDKLLPLPTRAPCQGDWAIAVDLPQAQSRLMGRRGLCGILGHMDDGRPGFWVMFEPPPSQSGSLPPEVVLLPMQNLVTLPSPPPGAARTPWEARHSLTAPPPMLCLPDEAAAEQLQLALCTTKDELEDDDDEASQDLSDDEEGEETSFEPGSLVVADVGGLAIHGRVLERVEGKKEALVEFLEGREKGGQRLKRPFAALSPVAEEDLILGAACKSCNLAEPEAKLLLCEMFGKKCLSCYHIHCLDPPLPSVPKESWFCQRCRSSKQEASPAKGKASEPARGSKEPASKGSGAKSAAGKAKGKPEARHSSPKAKAKAKGKAAGKK